MLEVFWKHDSQWNYLCTASPGKSSFWMLMSSQAAQPCQTEAHLHIIGAFKCPKKCDKKLWHLLCLEGHFLLSACQNKHTDWCVYVEKHQEHVWKLFPILLSCLPQIEDSKPCLFSGFAKFHIIPSFPKPLLVQKAGSLQDDSAFH